MGAMPRSITVVLTGELADTCRPGGGSLRRVHRAPCPARLTRARARRRRGGHRRGDAAVAPGGAGRALRCRAGHRGLRRGADHRAGAGGGHDGRRGRPLCRLLGAARRPPAAGPQRHRRQARAPPAAAAPHALLRGARSRPCPARSMCPQLRGLAAVKLATLLMLIGGLERAGEGGARIRGEIHMLLVGDPGTGAPGAGAARAVKTRPAAPAPIEQERAGRQVAAHEVRGAPEPARGGDHRQGRQRRRADRDRRARGATRAAPCGALPRAGGRRSPRKLAPQLFIE